MDYKRGSERVSLWHDDVRPAPKGWLWVRTNVQAQAALTNLDVWRISLDHDLGYHDVEIPDDPDELMEVLMLKGQSEETGLDLVEWMIAEGHVPSVITIHSWNPAGAKAMADRLLDSGLPISVAVVPFSASLLDHLAQEAAA